MLWCKDAKTLVLILRCVFTVGSSPFPPYSPFIKQDRFHFNSLFIWRIAASKYIRTNKINDITIFRSSHPELFIIKGILKICSKFTGEHPCWSVISINLLVQHQLYWRLTLVIKYLLFFIIHTCHRKVSPFE